MMRLAIGSDHAGFELKQELVEALRAGGHDVVDVGAHDAEPSDYPDFAEAVGVAVMEGRVERGIVICGSGVGAGIAANKLPGIRAGVCHDLYSASQGVEHDNMNVLVLGARVIEADLARELLQRFLQATFSGEERHVRRLKKIEALETHYACGGQALHAGDLRIAVEQRVAIWQEEDFAGCLWRKDPTLWFDKPQPEITDRLGWLDLPSATSEELDELHGFAEELKGEGTRHLVLLGMGGSSLAPEVFSRTFGSASGCPELIVLDSTHPAAVLGVERRVELAKTHFLVSSKSGTTTETLSFFRYFFEKVRKAGQDAGKHFSAVTDPGTPLETLGAERGFRRVFRARADLGGRYSALSHFGLVPAAAIGVDVRAFLDRAWTRAERCGFGVPVGRNPALVLGAALGEAALAGRDKLTVIASPAMASFPDWLEQLVAESTGKGGTGIVPVVGEPLQEANAYASDRVFVHLGVDGEDDGRLRERVRALKEAGHPLVDVRLRDRYDLSGEMFRWEMAIAAAGAVMGIHPFNQPDVELAKKLAREAMQEGGGDADVDTLRVDRLDDLKRSVPNWYASAGEGDYFCVQAYLAPTAEATSLLQGIRDSLGQGGKVATTLGFGPRFLHSTGQLHKGGANSGLFLQIVDDPGEDLTVPETDFSFRQLIQAQAQGDYQALKQRDRRILRVNVGADAATGLERLAETLTLP
jgi:transaldolase/glucose-6-phosphate isomerase